MDPYGEFRRNLSPTKYSAPEYPEFPGNPDIPFLHPLGTAGISSRNSLPSTDGELQDNTSPGRTLLMPKQDDGQRFRAKIIERLNAHEDRTNHKRSENEQYRVLVGHNEGHQWEEIVAYNDLVDFINKDESQDGLWKFREIQAHQGPSPIPTQTTKDHVGTSSSPGKLGR